MADNDKGDKKPKLSPSERLSDESAFDKPTKDTRAKPKKGGPKPA